MSRCFSFPPPDYEFSDERIGIMMESIKLKREKEKRREERKQRKKERRERSKIVLERRDAETEQSSLTQEQSLPKNTKNRKRNYCSTPESSSIRQINSYLPDAIVRGLELLECKDMMLAPQLEDSDWLYPEGRSEEKRQRYGTENIFCSRASTSWAWPPRAQYLHQIDAYALPYILPF